MPTPIQKPTVEDYIFAEEHPEWLNTPSPFDNLDEELKQLIVFYVFHVPVVGVSARAKPLESFGWGTKSKNDDFKQLKKKSCEPRVHSFFTYILPDVRHRLRRLLPGRYPARKQVRPSPDFSPCCKGFLRAWSKFCPGRAAA